MFLEDKYINPLTDFGFKKLFGEEVNKDLLIDFLNSLLPKKHTIKDLKYQQNEHLPSTEYDIKAIFDLYCVSASGEKFIVEIQRAKQNYFKDRSLFTPPFLFNRRVKEVTRILNLLLFTQLEFWTLFLSRTKIKAITNTPYS